MDTKAYSCKAGRSLETANLADLADAIIKPRSEVRIYSRTLASPKVVRFRIMPSVVYM